MRINFRREWSFSNIWASKRELWTLRGNTFTCSNMKDNCAPTKYTVTEKTAETQLIYCDNHCRAEPRALQPSFKVTTTTTTKTTTIPWSSLKKKYLQTGPHFSTFWILQTGFLQSGSIPFIALVENLLVICNPSKIKSLLLSSQLSRISAVTMVFSTPQHSKSIP